MSVSLVIGIALVVGCLGMVLVASSMFLGRRAGRGEEEPRS